MRFILFFSLFFVALAIDAHKIKKPVSLYNYGTGIKVTSIEYTTEATILTFKTTKECTPTLKIGHGIFIVDDNGVCHNAIGADGIKLDSLYVMVKGQPRKFSIAFDPVNNDNQALDVRETNMFGIYGLHDAKRVLDIPEASCELDCNEIDSARFATDWVDIDGFIQDEDDQNSIIYACYFSERPYLDTDKYERYSRVDEDGCFNMRFRMHSPKSCN